ncbi:efflux RND transporter periplasmic adaptor subunit [Bradyrhizobium arachidis]|uniref:efflux RND transporter periplasmic adaptor subunit n=1 Tax=Bradyrhizobium TaxID=374 RepID=UPI000A03343C
MAHRARCCLRSRPQRSFPIACFLSVAVSLAGCSDRSGGSSKAPTLVRTETVRLQDRQGSTTLTGDVQARVRAELSFRVSGRVIERLVDVGAHVNEGDVLARLDPTEQQADLDAAIAKVAGAETEVRVTSATFTRQKTLIAQGFTTRSSYEQAQEALRTAEASLDAAKAEVGTAKDNLSFTELRAKANGVITARNIEVGQVAQAAQSAFTLAEDGARDAVFDVYESIFFGQPESSAITLTLVSDPAVKAQGRAREVSPTIDPKTATVRVKIAIDNPPAAMTLGSAVTGTVRWRPKNRIVLPWSAMTADGTAPAVWVVDSASNTVSLKPIVVDDYETGIIVIKSGLQPGDRVVTDGGKLLSPGQAVTFDREGGA